MTLPQPEIYRDFHVIPEFNYTTVEGDYTGNSDWFVMKPFADTGTLYPCMTLYEVKESIDDLLNQ